MPLPFTDFARHRLSAVLSALCALCSPALTKADCLRYAVDVIPGPPCSIVASASAANGISPTGEICGGWSDCNENGHPAIWLGQGGWINFPAQPGIAGIEFFGMNSSRHVAGTAYIHSENITYLHAAFFDTTTGTMIDIGPLPGQDYSEGLAIKQADVVSATSNNVAHGPLRGFIWKNGQSIALQLPFGTDSYAHDISDTGFVCGWMGTSPFIDAHAYRWLNGQTVDLGSGLAGALGADARGVSNMGAVCGFSAFMDPDPRILYRKRACLWTDSQTIDLGILPGFRESLALDVNDSNVVIGYCDGGQYDIAFVWHEGVMNALNALIPPGSNLRIQFVWRINNAG